MSPNWKKVIVSGSDAYLNSANIETSVTASEFIGDGSQITGVVSSSYAESSSFATTFGVGGQNYIGSRGLNLITNGFGNLGNNYNFSDFQADFTQSFFGGPSFRLHRESTSTSGGPALIAHEFIALDPTEEYLFSCYMKTDTPGVRHYLFVEFYDIDELVIGPEHVFIRAGTETKLTQDLELGDTHVFVEDASSFQNAGAFASARILGLYPYTNSFGYVYPDYTYTRHVGPPTGHWDEGGISGNTITLRESWSLANPDDQDGTWPSGSSVANHMFGATRTYVGPTNALTATEWTNYSGVLTPDMVRPGAAYAKIGWLLNRDEPGPKSTWVDGVTFSLNNVPSASFAGTASFFDGVASFPDGLDVTGSLFVDGDVTASFYVGDGSLLAGVIAETATTASYVQGANVHGTVFSATSASHADNSNFQGIYGLPTLVSASSQINYNQIQNQPTTIPTASYVQGSNVDGIVGSAVTANTASYVQAGNVDGTVTNAVSASFVPNPFVRTDKVQTFTPEQRFSNRVVVGSTGSSVPNLVLDVRSTDAALAPPRMTSTQRDAISTSGLAGGVVYNTSDNKLSIREGSNWRNIATTTDIDSIQTVPTASYVSGTIEFTGDVVIPGSLRWGNGTVIQSSDDLAPFLIKRQIFNPGSITEASVTAFTLEDISGLEVEFDAPPSGKAFAVVSGLARVSWNSTALQRANYHWAVREGSSVIEAGESIVVRMGMGGTTGTVDRRVGARVTLTTGIQESLSGTITWKLSHRLNRLDGTAAVGLTEWGGDNVGPMFIDIWGMP